MTIRKALFKVIKFNQDLLDISSKIGQHPKLNNGAYIGVHLRGEADWPHEFGPVEDQMRLYTAEIQRIQKTVSYNIKTIYVSVSGAKSLSRAISLTFPTVRRRRCHPAIQGRPQTPRVHHRVKIYTASFVKRNTRTSRISCIRPKSHCRIPNSCRCSILRGHCHVLDVISDRIFPDN